MNLTHLIQTGVINRPKGMFWYGLEGTRKTGTAVQFPKALILDLEHGSDQYDCQRVTIVNFGELLQTLDLVINEEHDRETVVLDGLEWAEKLVAAILARP
jgi:AAA domain-containing protein